MRAWARIRLPRLHRRWPGRRAGSKFRQGSFPRPSGVSPDKGRKIVGRWSGVDFRSAFCVERDLRAMERMAAKHELPEQILRHSFAHEAEHEGGIGTVE